MPKERILLDPSPGSPTTKRVLVAEKPDGFRSASGRTSQRILSLLSSGPMYPAEMARKLNLHHQVVYYNVRKLEKAGLVSRVKKEPIHGGTANLFALATDGYAVEFQVKGEPAPPSWTSTRSRALGFFLKEFINNGSFDGWIVVGSPLQHGANGTQARDGHYAVQLGFALGQFVSLPSMFPVKLDVDIRAERLLSSNLIVVGGPRTNTVSEDLNSQLPVRFKEGGWGSIVDQDGRSFSSELDCIVAKIPNPFDPRKTCVVAAGLTGAGTKASIIGLCNYSDVLFKDYRFGNFAAVLRGVDKDGDGKVDSVEILKRLVA